MNSVKENVRAIIAELTEVEIEQVQDDTKFVEELDADSLKALELLALLEKDYKVKIPEANLKRLSTLNNTMQVLEEAMTAANKAG
jgi:acyl carrier protein